MSKKIINKISQARRTAFVRFTATELKYFRMGLGCYIIVAKRNKNEQRIIRRILKKLDKEITKLFHRG